MPGSSAPGASEVGSPVPRAASNATQRTNEVSNAKKSRGTLQEVFGSFGNEPMQSCSVRRVVLSLASLVSSASSVYSFPSDSFDHRNFISCKYM